MFGLDLYSLKMLVPSVLGVVAMASVMVWGFVRVCRLVSQEPPRQG
jgi:hypothetical protein